MKIVEFSLRKRVTISMVVVVLIIFGFMSYLELGLDMFPDLEMPYISVITTYSGVSSEDIEENITRPLEQWISTVSNVEEVKSMSQEGISIITVEFESDTNLDFAAQDVRDKIGLFENFLPEGAKNPLVMKFNVSDWPIMMYGVTGKKRDLKQMKDYIDNEVATRLERLDGVASAIVFSPEETEVLVSVDKGKLESRGISIKQIELAIQASNINLPSGYMVENHQEYLIRSIGKFQKSVDINEVVVRSGHSGELVFLKDLAEIKETSKEVRSLTRIQGTKGIIMFITKSHGANTVLVAREIKKTLEEIKPTLDKDIKFHMAVDFSEIIEIMASKSSRNILVGGILAMFLIFLFLRNIRPTLAIGIAIPLSVITTFIALYLANYTLNLITLGGLALGVGMLVDNAVVVIENIFRHLEEGKSPSQAANIGTSEVGTAIIASTLTTIAVFFPMMFATGVAGTFSRGLAVAVAFSLLSSLFVALTIIPMLASWLFKIKKGKKISSLKLGKDKFEKYRNFYEKILRKSLTRRVTILISVIVIFFISVLVAIFLLGSEFLPDTDRSMVFLKLRMPVGTNLQETNRIIKYIEDQALKDENVITTSTTVGVNEQNAQDSASGFNPSGSYEAVLWANLITSSKRNISDKQIIEKWRQYFPELKTGKIQFIDIAQASMGGGGSNNPIEVNVFGRDLKELERITESIKDSIISIEGIRDVAISLDKSKPELLLKIKKEEASKMGLTPYDISSQVETFTIGTIASRIMLEGEERDIRVRLNEKDRNSIEALKKLPVFTPSGTKIYLSQVIEFQRSFGALKIDRENQVRKVSVTANYVDRDLDGIVNEIREKSRTILNNLPKGYFYEMGGQYKEMQEAFATMLVALILAIVLVYAVMASQFESLRNPFIIMFTIPLAFIGVVFLLGLTGKNISLASIMGFIMLGGIVVNNGIVMVDYINQLIESGLDKFEAVVKGAVVRFRPILITALSTMLGMTPMAVSISEGSEMRSPMAISIIGGLMASTFLTLFIVPIIYTYFSKIKIPKA